MLNRLPFTLDIYISLMVIPQYLAFFIANFCKNKLLEVNRVPVESDTITAKKYPCYFDVKMQTSIYDIVLFFFLYNLPSSD